MYILSVNVQCRFEAIIVIRESQLTQLFQVSLHKTMIKHPSFSQEMQESKESPPESYSLQFMYFIKQSDSLITGNQ